MYPVAKGGWSSSGSRSPSGESQNPISAHDYVWRFGTHVPAQTIRELSSGRIRKGITLYLLRLLIAAIGSLFLAHERRRAVRFLGDLHSERRLCAITAELGEGLVLLDSNGRVKMVNPKAEKLLGWSEAAFLGQDFHALGHCHSDLPKESCPVYRVQRTDRLIHVEEDRFTSKSGGLLPVAYTAVPFLFDHDEAGIILTFEDTTERNRRPPLGVPAASRRLT